MTSSEWLNKIYKKYPEEIENINKHRTYIQFVETENNVSGSFRFGDELYGTIYTVDFGSKEEVKKEYLNRSIDLAYQLFEEKMFNFQLKRMKEDLQFFYNTLFNMTFKNEGHCIINEIEYFPKVNFCGSMYTISKYKKDPKTGNTIGINTIDNIIEEIKDNYYNKFAIRSGYRLKAAFCQLLDFLNNETE